MLEDPLAEESLGLGAGPFFQQLHDLAAEIGGFIQSVDPEALELRVGEDFNRLPLEVELELLVSVSGHGSLGVGLERVPTMTRLSVDNRRWVDRWAPLFGGVSSFLNLVVTIVRGAVAAGILPWELERLQLLHRNASQQENEDALPGGAALKALAATGA